MKENEMNELEKRNELPAQNEALKCRLMKTP